MADIALSILLEDILTRPVFLFPPKRIPLNNRNLVGENEMDVVMGVTRILVIPVNSTVSTHRMRRYAHVVISCRAEKPVRHIYLVGG